MIPPAYRVADNSVSTGNPGFLVRPYQTDAAQPNNLLWTEQQLLGLQGPNIADLTSASGGLFTETGIVNYNMAAPGAVGNFTVNNGYEDLMFPGYPGTGGTSGTILTGNSSVEVLTYVRFPTAGLYQLGVNSDDGFRVTAGRAPGDLLGVILGFFDGGRGSSDTLFSVLVDPPGYYPIRLIWENGSGELPDNGANLEFFSVVDGTKIPVNDTIAGALKAYRASTAAGPSISNLNPLRGAAGVPGNVGIMAEISHGSVQVDAATVKAKRNGADATVQATTVGSKTTVNLTNTGLLPSGSAQTVSLEFQDKASPPNTYTYEWSFTVAVYSVISEDLRTDVGTGDNSKPGLKARVYQIDQLGTVGLINYSYRAEQELAGVIGANVADLSMATAGIFEVDTVNWNQDAAGIGSFPNDETPIPGIPGLGNATYNTDNVAAELISYLEFPTAGYYQMGVNSDDGFKVTVADTPPANNLALVITGNASAAGSYYTVVAPVATAKPFTGPISGKLVYMSPADGCTAPANAAALAGNIALVDRGVCEFSIKIKNAKDAGAIAVVVVNSRTDDLGAWPEGVFPIEMGVGAAGYQDIPAVMISQPDGAKIMTGIASDLTASLVPDATPAVGVFEGGRGATDTIFSFIVPTAGVYPFRCVWYEGGGGANLEWFSVTPSGQKILVNDRSNAAALKGYRARTANPQPIPTISVAAQGGNVVITFTGSLESADAVSGPWTSVAGTSPLTVPASGPQRYFRAKR